MPKKKRRKRKGHYQRGEYLSKKSGATCKFRSGWEEKFMSYLDSEPTIANWTYEKVVIEYVANLRTKKIRKYYPDFYVEYVDGHVEVIEIKPKRKLEQAIIKKKTAAAKVWCEKQGATYRILTEIELKDMGLL
jgi:hypothetical protein